jgi:membrane protein required for colicin V production
MGGIAVIDIIFLFLGIIIVARSALRGFVSELLSMTAVILGLLAALFFNKNGGAFIRDKFMPDMKLIPEILAFIGLFLIVFILIKIVEYILQDIIARIRLGGLDRFLGFLLGLVEGVIVISLLLFVLVIQPLFDPASIVEKSFFANLLLPIITKGEYGHSAVTVLLLLLQQGYV